jgi:hypothetical protein
MSYFFHPAAEAEYLDAIAFYESKRPGLGATYLSQSERVIAECLRGSISKSHRNAPGRLTHSTE